MDANLHVIVNLPDDEEIHSDHNWGDQLWGFDDFITELTHKHPKATSIVANFTITLD